MTAENKLYTLRLYDMLSMEGGERFFESIAASFESRNLDVEQFFRKKAVQAAKLSTAATYLVISYENRKFDVLGYFTLATKMLTLKQKSLSKSECKAISRFGYFDEDSEAYKLPAILIAQLSRNFCPDSASLCGDELLHIALNLIRDLLHSTSGKAVFLECEQEERILQFYKKNGFQVLDTTVISKNSKELAQLYMIV